MVERASGALTPFKRDKLFVSILECCKHRPTALDDASSLTQQILGKLLQGQSRPGIVSLGNIITTSHAVLHRFDRAAATFYKAYHHL